MLFCLLIFLRLFISLFLFVYKAFQMEIVEVRTVIKYLRKKGMTSKGIHEDFMNKI